jgi:hypothetical protein
MIFIVVCLEQQNIIYMERYIYIVVDKQQAHKLKMSWTKYILDLIC